jgi:hypothetical protein
MYKVLSQSSALPDYQKVSKAFNQFNGQLKPVLKLLPPRIFEHIFYDFISDTPASPKLAQFVDKMVKHQRVSSFPDGFVFLCVQKGIKLTHTSSLSAHVKSVLHQDPSPEQCTHLTVVFPSHFLKPLYTQVFDGMILDKMPPSHFIKLGSNIGVFSVIGDGQEEVNWYTPYILDQLSRNNLDVISALKKQLLVQGTVFTDSQHLAIYHHVSGKLATSSHIPPNLVDSTDETHIASILLKIKHAQSPQDALKHGKYALSCKVPEARVTVCVTDVLNAFVPQVPAKDFLKSDALNDLVEVYVDYRKHAPQSLGLCWFLQSIFPSDSMPTPKQLITQCVDSHVWKVLSHLSSEMDGKSSLIDAVNLYFSSQDASVGEKPSDFKNFLEFAKTFPNPVITLLSPSSQEKVLGLVTSHIETNGIVPTYCSPFLATFFSPILNSSSPHVSNFQQHLQKLIFSYFITQIGSGPDSVSNASKSILGIASFIVPSGTTTSSYEDHLWDTLSNSCPGVLQDACDKYIQAQPEDQQKQTKTQWNAALKPLGLAIS